MIAPASTQPLLRAGQSLPHALDDLLLVAGHFLQFVHIVRQFPAVLIQRVKVGQVEEPAEDVPLEDVQAGIVPGSTDWRCAAGG